MLIIKPYRAHRLFDISMWISRTLRENSHDDQMNRRYAKGKYRKAKFLHIAYHNKLSGLPLRDKYVINWLWCSAIWCCVCKDSSIFYIYSWHCQLNLPQQHKIAFSIDYLTRNVRLRFKIIKINVRVLRYIFVDTIPSIIFIIRYK